MNGDQNLQWNQFYGKGFKMEYKGFRLRKLTLSGEKVKNAEVCFKNGLNLIIGPSDTGKSFIFQCVDYLLGSSTPPKNIDELDGYEMISLEIEISSKMKNVILQRSIRHGKTITILNFKEEPYPVKSTHQAKNFDNISHFLLSFIGLTQKKIKFKANKTQNFTFRRIAPLTMVSEEDIIKDTSPFLSGQFTSVTPEKHALKLLLTNDDDSSIRDFDDIKIINANTNGKKELLNLLIETQLQSFKQLKINLNLEEMEDELKALEAKSQEASSLSNSLTQMANEKECKRNAVLNELRIQNTRVSILEELKTKFSLLEEQYKSDINRLKAINETTNLLSSIEVNHCPTCGAERDHFEKENAKYDFNPDEMSISCKAEKNKITLLLNDLKLAIKDIDSEYKNLIENRMRTKEELSLIEEELTVFYKTKIEDILNDLEVIKDRIIVLNKGVSFLQRINELDEQLRVIPDGIKISKQSNSDQIIAPNKMKELCEMIEELIKLWQCPDMNSVIFNYKSFDIVISGAERASHGKGVRAIMHSAVTLGLLKYCIANNLSHPGFVILDSPLLVYQESKRDNNEKNYSDNVKCCFYNDLAKNYKDQQIVIIENEVPPEFIINDSSVNIIKFTEPIYDGFIPFNEKK